MVWDDRVEPHDGAEGLSPQGWLPDRVSVGALTKAFPPELVDRVAYAKLSLKKYSPIAARNEDKKVCSGLL